VPGAAKSARSSTRSFPTASPSIKHAAANG
jgi:hypothetical protein